MFAIGDQEFRKKGFKAINDKPGLTEYEVSQLDANDIWKFDRIDSLTST